MTISGRFVAIDRMISPPIAIPARSARRARRSSRTARSPPPRSPPRSRRRSGPAGRLGASFKASPGSTTRSRGSRARSSRIASRPYITVATSVSTSPIAMLTVPAVLRPTRPMKIAVMTGQIAQRPGQLILSSMPWRSASRPATSMKTSRARARPAPSAAAARSASTRRRRRSPARGRHRVHQRAEAAVLARHARGDAVGVVAPGDDAEEHRRQRPGPVVASKRGPGTSGSAPGGRSRWRSGSSTGSAARPAASRAAAAPSGRGPTAARSVSAALLYGRLATAPRTASRRRPCSGTPPSWSARPRRACASARPGLQRALADRQAQRHAEQLGVGELLARRRRRGRRRAPRGPSAHSSA